MSSPGATPIPIRPDLHHGGPWYQHGWVWFIVILLGTTVVAGIVTVFIAVQGADSLVVDDYYEDGKAINRSLAADREAAIREVRAVLSARASSPTLELSLLGEAPESLVLTLSHVTQSTRDARFVLARDAQGGYRAPSSLPTGRYYATLTPARDPGAWRVRALLVLPLSEEATLEPAR